MIVLSVNEFNENYLPLKDMETLTIINVVESLMGIVGVIHDERTPEAVAVLSREVTMVPIGTCAAVPVRRASVRS